MKSFKVLKPGPLTTVQDTGRTGHCHLGLTEGGPMDMRSFMLANRLVGNKTESAALEITFGGLILQCLTPTTIALTGAYCPLIINGKAHGLWQSHAVRPGDIIELGFAAVGVRAYLAVSGGIDSPAWFHSQSTVLREGLGIALEKEQTLKTHSSMHHPALKLDYQHQPSLRKKAELEFVAGYQWSQIPLREQQRFMTHTFTVSAGSDRMGCQLAGPAIQTRIESLYSEGIATGSIQITGEGKPIILMRDRQTIGGYPKLGAITTESQSILAQLPQGSDIRFKAISPEASIEKLRAFYQEIDSVRLLNN